MDKKELKMYATPEVEIVNVAIEGHIMTVSLDEDESSLPNPEENMED